ncbi:MAG TPA: RNA-binding protein, partial [Polyangiaceae bacterium]
MPPAGEGAWSVSASVERSTRADRRRCLDLEKFEMRLYVGNLAYSTTEDTLRNEFGKFGNVTS